MLQDMNRGRWIERCQVQWNCIVGISLCQIFRILVHKELNDLREEVSELHIAHTVVRSIISVFMNS